ncbi:hypothetical protein HA402_007817 [Bradysia odoriphaga]|nr:hypothetical protein HA402_007817 [Bradysia odoriphaga]
MEITPACYPHLLSPLLTLANGKVAVVLEGGYCLQSLAEGAALTLRTILGDPCPKLVEPLSEPCDSIQETILNCIQLHRPYWNCLQTNGTYTLEEYNNFTPQSDLHKVVQAYNWTEPRQERFLTRDCYPVQSDEFLKKVAERLTSLSIATNLTVPPNRVCYVYDDMMLLHRNLYEDHPERPERLEMIEQRFKEYNLFQRLHRLPVRSATTDELCLAHTRLHINSMRKIVESKELQESGEKFNSVYFHPKTFECACVAAGSVLQVVDDVLNGNSRSGVCVIRPPGHHAESDLPHGFCIFNNVAVAAQYAIRDHGLKRVLIVDWDVHHGNGTQHIFESSPNVLYMSIHRYDYGHFFPRSEDANFNVVGEGTGTGFNVNIPWNAKGMGDMEYIAAFQRIILPIAYEFAPELVLISAGFDAALGDPLGGCKVTPEAYGYFTHWLSALANGKLIVCLEGGYNVNSISYAMAACTKALLGDPLPVLLTNKRLNSSCVETIQNVLSVQQKYWRSLRFNKKLPNFDIQRSPIDDLYKEFNKVNIAEANDGDTNSGKKGDSSPGASRDAQPSTSTAAASNNSAAKTLAEFLAENKIALQNEEMFAVYPLKTCPHLSSLNPDLFDSIDTTKSCMECQSTSENWICLGCTQVFCGRFVNEHMLYHHLDSDHPLTLSFADLSVWCYKCDSYIDNPCLFKYKNLAHQSKFGEELVWSYGNTLELDAQSSSTLS